MSGDRNDKSLTYALSAATPDVRRNVRSRIARRSVGGPLLQQTASFLDTTTDSPVLHLRETPRARTRILDRSTTADRSFTGNTPKTNKSFNESAFQSARSMLGESAYDFSMSLFENDLEISRPDDASSSGGRFLYEHFYRAYQEFPSEQNAFDLIQRYEECSSNAIELLQEAIQYPGQNIEGQEKQLLEYLVQERNTWKLFRIIYEDRVKDEDVQMNFEGPRCSDKQLVDHLFKIDSSVRQTQLVVDWLESNMSQDLDHLSAVKIQYLSESHIAWENTLHALSRSSQDQINLGNRPLITEMDPDAPKRLKRSLHDQDVEDEYRLYKYMFAFILAGKLDEAQKTAERHGYFWLAAALEGWRPFHDPNYNSKLQEGQELEQVEGNQYRDIWKSTCWKMIDSESLPLFERGLYAAMSNHLTGLLPICQNWEEQLWAYARVAVSAKVEEEIRSATHQQRKLVDLPVQIWNAPSNLQDIFKELESSPNENIRKACSNSYHVIQKHIITDQLDDLLSTMLSWVKENTNLTHHLLRFMAHFALLIRLVGWANHEQACLAILESYVLLLIQTDQKALVASYVATLPPQLQVLLYAKFLEGVFGNEEQRLVLELAEVAGLDVHLITKTVVENIRERTSIDSNAQLASETNQFDIDKINALDWLIFDPSQRAEAVKQGNCLMRVFIACRKIDAARKTLAKLPSDTIHVITRHFKQLSNSGDLPPEEDNTIREYLCLQTYLQSLEAFNDWFEHFYHSKPAEPIKPSESKTVKFTDWVAYEHKRKHFESDSERWQTALKAQTKSTLDRLYNVLLFPDGGWMVDQCIVEDVDEKRQQQMALLRKLCVPQVCSILQTVLHSSKRYQECVQLADVVADEKNCLYNEFNKQELRDFLSKIRESSLEMLDTNLDPFGYPYL